MDNEKLIPMYVLVYSLINLLVFSYAIFELDRSPWYFLLMIFIDSLIAASLRRFHIK